MRENEKQKANICINWHIFPFTTVNTEEGHNQKWAEGLCYFIKHSLRETIAICKDTYSHGCRLLPACVTVCNMFLHCFFFPPSSMSVSIYGNSWLHCTWCFIDYSDADGQLDTCFCFWSSLVASSYPLLLYLPLTKWSTLPVPFCTYILLFHYPYIIGLSSSGPGKGH